MLLRYFLDNEGKRVYTLSTTTPEGAPTFSAHPARFSPDDKFSQQRIATKKRHNVLMSTKPMPDM